jgi:hypothetical protein
MWHLMLSMNFELEITGFQDFVHCPEFEMQENSVSETGSVSVLRLESDTPTLSGPFRKS